jgi:hypothetical protein
MSRSIYRPSTGKATPYDWFALVDDLALVHGRALNAPFRTGDDDYSAPSIEPLRHRPARDLVEIAGDLGEVRVAIDCCQQWLAEEQEDGLAPAHAAARTLPHLTEAHEKLGELIAELHAMKREGK